MICEVPITNENGNEWTEEQSVNMTFWILFKRLDI